MSRTKDDHQLFVTKLEAPGMDCPSEEAMIRMAVEAQEQIVDLSFDLAKREITVFHKGLAVDFLKLLIPLGLGIGLIESHLFSEKDKLPAVQDPEAQARSLQWLLLINGCMFFIELTVGLLAQSAGLIADSLDMLADASVYAISLYVVKRSSRLQVKAAHVSGWLQMILAFGVLIEVGRRFLFGSEPVSILMISFGCVALIANIVCLMIIFRHREGGAHMKASWIFSANDVIANSGVILAGVLVLMTGSNYPDLVIGATIGIVVLLGARRILKLES